MVSAEIAHTTQHGAMEGNTQTKAVKYYNLDAIISSGYRVNSLKATKFRIWQQISDVFAEISYDYDNGTNSQRIG